MVVAPRIRFLQQKQKNTQSKKIKSSDDSEEETNSIQKKSSNSDAFNFIDPPKQTDDNDDSLFTVKKNVQLKFDGDEEVDEEEKEPLAQKKIKIKTKASIVKQIRKKNLKVNEKVQFDDDGNVIFL